MESQIDAENAALSALVATHRAPEIREADDLYGWLVGSWELDVRHYKVDVTALGMKGEALFFRALEGRAVQDVWIMPARTNRNAGLSATNNMYGTTLRIWDSSIPGLAYHLCQPGDGTARRTHWPLERQRHRPGWNRSGRHTHPLEFHQYQGRCLPLDWRSTRA